MYWNLCLPEPLFLFYYFILLFARCCAKPFTNIISQLSQGVGLGISIVQTRKLRLESSGKYHMASQWKSWEEWLEVGKASW